MSINIGSNWIKWDLHVHTPFSNLNSGYSCSTDQFLEKLKSSDVDVFGITNYFTISRQEYNDVVVPARAAKKCLLNFEFRLSQPNRAKEFINLHVLFNDSVDYDKIVASLSRVQLINSIGGKSAYCSESDLKAIGYDVAVVEFATLIAQLKADFTEKGEYILIAPTNGYGGFRPEQGDGRGKAIAVEYDRNVHAIFGSSISDQNYFLDEERYTGALAKPVFNGSDAHKLDDIASKYTWIKARPTFEGIIEAIHEPKDRVLIVGRPPRIEQIQQTPEKFIVSVSINSSRTEGEWFDKVGKININPGLVSIIGNKGSGKSALADMIALSGNSHVEDFTFLTKTKFLKATCHKKYDVEIEFANHLKYRKRFAERPDFTKTEHVLYLTQSFIEQLCSEIPTNDRTRLREEIDKVIFNHIPAEERLGFENVSLLIEHIKSSIGKNISESEIHIRELNELIVDLEKKTSKATENSWNSQLKELQDKLALHLLTKPQPIAPESETIESKEIHRLEHWKRIVTQLGSTYQLNLSAMRKNRDRFERSVTSIDSFKATYDKLVSDYADLHQISDGRIDVKNVIKLTIDKSLIEAEVGKIKAEEEKARLSLAKAQKLGIVIEQRIKNLLELLAGKNKEIETRRIEIQSWDETLAKLNGSPITPNSIEFINGEIEKLKSIHLTALNKLYEDRDAETIKLLAWINDREQKMSYLYGYSNSKIEDIAREFDINKNDFIAFSSERIVSQDFTSDFLQHINLNKSGTYFRCGDGKESFVAKFAASIVLDDLSSIASIPAILLKSLKFTIQNCDEDVTGRVEAQIEDQLKKSKLELYNYLYTFSYIKHQFTIKYAGKPIEYLSPGEKGILLLTFFLLFDDSGKPIIIDQPEENLDNETIYKRLVKFIKKAKQVRQIVLVTHNPNLGVVCDSEQIIVSSIRRETDNRITYVAGAIEDGLIKDHALRILEGTEQAFVSRLKKYAVKNRESA